MTIPLAKRPLSDIPCACGCGRLARVNSKLHAAECEAAYHRITCRAHHRKMREAVREKRNVKNLTWQERRQIIIDKYGVGMRHEQ